MGVGATLGWDLGGGVFFLITCPRSRGAQLRPLGQRALHVAHAIPLSFSDRSTVAMPARAAPGASPLGSLEGVADFADQKFQDILQEEDYRRGRPLAHERTVHAGALHVAQCVFNLVGGGDGLEAADAPRGNRLGAFLRRRRTEHP